MGGLGGNNLIKTTVINGGGGLARNRTGMEGFAVLCVTIPPRGLCPHEPWAPAYTKARVLSQGVLSGQQAGPRLLALCKGGAGLLYALAKKRDP